MSGLHERLLLLRASAGELRARRSARRIGIALVYHRVAAASGDSRLELAPAVGRELFGRELRHLRDRYAPVAPSAFADAVAGRARGARIPVTVTFDDDTRSHLDEAVPALRAVGLTAGFFVGGWGLHDDARPWWEALQLAVDHERLTPEETALPAAGIAAALRREPGAIRRLGRAVEELEPDARAALAGRLARATADLPHDAGLDAGALRALASSHELGFHTRAHDPLPSLPDRRLDQALQDGRGALEETLGRRLEAIAYPHGQADARVRAAAGRAGYLLGFAGLNRAATPTDDRLLQPRLSPSHASLGVFALTVAAATLTR